MSQLPYRYRVFGLEIESEIELEGLEPGAERSAADAAVHVGKVELPADLSGHHALIASGTVIRIPEVGSYLICDGRKIIVDAEAGSSTRDRNLFLLGSAFGALLHQRGLLPLHANSVVIGGLAVAFCGHSGAGKSTLAAWFHDRGFPVLADDVSVISPAHDGMPHVSPGLPRVRLWREALEASGRDPGLYPQSYAAADKFDVPMRSPEVRPIPLLAVYLLAAAPADSRELRVTRLRGVEAIDTLVANTYRGAYVRDIGSTGRHLQACVEIARTVPIFRAERPWSLERFDDHACLLEAHARRLLGNVDAGAARGGDEGKCALTT